MKKTFNLLEATALSALDKMRLFDRGERRENLKACGTEKLLDYYLICLNNSLSTAEKFISIELQRRDLGNYVMPRVSEMSAEQFTPYELEYVLENRDSPRDIIHSAVHHPFAGLTESETLVIYLIWAIALNLTGVSQAIRSVIYRYGTYHNKMQKILKEISSKPDVMTTIADIINGFDFAYKEHK